MKSIMFYVTVIFIIGMVVMGCAASEPCPVPLPPVAAPKVISPVCSDKLFLLEEEALRHGVTCQENAKVTFPLSYYQQGKVLVLCQCK